MFAQLVVGPPGVGKSTYCQAVGQALNHMDRKTIIVNLDPANDICPGYCDVDISNLISLRDAMDEFGLGPNGALNYCIDYLASNIDWLQIRLREHPDSYVLFDFPGQAELYSHHSAITSIIHSLQQFGYQLCVVQLMDSHQCVDIHRFVSAALLALQSMMHLQLPQVNVLSKVDIVHAHNHLSHPLTTFTHPDETLLDLINDSSAAPIPSGKKSRYARLSYALAEVVADYSLVGYVPFCATDPLCLQAIIVLVDKASGFMYSPVSDDVSVASAIQAVIDKYDTHLTTRECDAADQQLSDHYQDSTYPSKFEIDNFDRLEQLQNDILVQSVVEH